MRQPDGYDDNTGRVCKLHRSLYGLKQAPRCWKKRLLNFLSSQTFVQSTADPCLFSRVRDARELFVAIYVDDGLIVGTDEKDVSNFVDVLKREFKITENKAECFLGLQIVRQEDGSLFIHQTAYIKKLLKKLNMMEANSVAIPIETARYGNSEASAPVNVPYREAIGGLLYLKTGTRPDIAFSVSVLSEKVENPKEEDWVAVKRVFR